MVRRLHAERGARAGERVVAALAGSIIALLHGGSVVRAHAVGRPGCAA
jgi:hypothetical protein